MSRAWNRIVIVGGALALMVAVAPLCAARERLPVRATFRGAHGEKTWPIEALGSGLPRDWTGYEFLVIEFRASSSQRFDLGLDTDRGRLSKRIGPFAGVWVRASIPLRFFREPAGNGVDMAATYNQPRAAYWINLGGGHVGPTTDVRGLTVEMDDPVGAPVFELRALRLERTDPGDAVLDGTPLVDEFGQYRHVEWPGKAHTLDELTRAWAAEARSLPETSAERCPYGGFVHTAATATGFFHVEQIDGRWWFVCPDGHLFFSTGINGVGPFSGTRVQGRERLFTALPPGDLFPAAGPGTDRGRGPSGSFLTWNLARRFGVDGWLSRWAAFTTRRLAAWGFNSIHYWQPRGADETAEPRVPYAQMLRGWQTSDSIMGMPDVYAAEFPDRVERTAAQQLDARSRDPWMLGYFIGNEPPWPGREGLLVDAILAGPDGAMQRRLKAHLAGGDTQERRRVFVYAAFERYVEIVNAACRRHAPHHLNLGIRFGGDAHDDLIRTLRGVDVFSYNTYRYVPSRATLDRLYTLVQRPILIGEFHIGAPERGLASGLVQAMNQEERGVAYRYFVEQGAAHPALVGAHWFQWADQPATGRNDGENYNIGFVDVTDRPYGELVEAATLTHARVLDVHRGRIPAVTRRPRASVAGTPVEKPPAAPEP
jgi:hypothetical protein